MKTTTKPSGLLLPGGATQIQLLLSIAERGEGVLLVPMKDATPYVVRNEDGRWYPGNYKNEPVVSGGEFVPPYHIGETHWVREAYDIVDDPAAYHIDDGPRESTGYECPDAVRRGPNDERWVVDYRCDNNIRLIDKCSRRKWRSAKSMPAWASRLTITFRAVAAKQLRDVSEAEAMAAGFTGFHSPAYVAGGEIVGADGQLPTEELEEQWPSLHTSPYNPAAWVWVYRVEVCRK